MSKSPLRKLNGLLKFKDEYSPGAGFGTAIPMLEDLITNEQIVPDEKQIQISAVQPSDKIISESNTGKENTETPEQINDDWKSCSSLAELNEMIKDCRKCRVLADKRKNLVFGSGNPNADIAVVGEAPGADEDEKGFPFVGRAGKLLTDILAAINFSRDEVYICNILKCRPPENRNPLPDEIFNCEPYLNKQLEIIKPKLILALGTFAAQTLLGTKEPLGKLRGRFHTYKNIKTMVTYHPAALLRNPNWKRPTWEDVKLFRKEYDSISARQ